jgi:NDP-hexose C3-ketoreductase / dTDP-4-oxo-2-deoxy-alpha-D-pentos-2-ene 2,3-reductase
VEITQLGLTGLKVSRLCLGTVNLGPRTSEEDAQEIRARPLDEGVRFFDIADIYGPDGLTEEIVGRWLAKDGRREQTAPESYAW